MRRRQSISPSREESLESSDDVWRTSMTLGLLLSAQRRETLCRLAWRLDTPAGLVALFGTALAVRLVIAPWVGFYYDLSQVIFPVNRDFHIVSPGVDERADVEESSESTTAAASATSAATTASAKPGRQIGRKLFGIIGDEHGANAGYTASLH